MDSLAAVVLAAGKGTRMKSSRAKVLHELCGRPMAAFSIEQAVASGASPVVVVVGHQADETRLAVEAALPGAPLRFALQAEQLGTAHAVLCAKDGLAGFSGKVLILYGDAPLLTAEGLAALARAGREAPVALVATRPPDPRGYGRLIRDAAGALIEIREEKDCTAELKRIGEVNAGLYCVDSALLWDALGRIGAANAQGEFYLTDLVAHARGQGARVATVELPFDEVAGVNDRAELADAGAVLRRRRNVALMRFGVTLVDPATTYVDYGVTVEPDCVLEPGVSIRGRSTLGAGTRVGQGAVIVDSHLAAGVEVRPYCHLEQARVGAGSLVGPFARLRPGTELAEGVHLGNFVETKKARLGKGSKANHLTYLGDAEIGAGVNVGCGTITCNYDGANKFVTRIEDGVFVGSDVQLIAPVTVGKGAYIGTGTTVREDVPAGALAVSAGKQRNIEGWVDKKKPRKASGG